MESQEIANPLSRSAIAAMEEKNPVPHGPAKLSPSTRVDEEITAEAQPIYDIAKECIVLFGKFLQQPKNQLTETISTCQRRFQSWTVYVGVFVHKSASLDTQLKLEPGVQDLVMVLLDVLQEDMRRVVKLESRNLISQCNPLSHGSGNTNSNDDTLSNAARGVLDGIVESVDGLHRLTTRIKTASRGDLSLEEKIVDFAKHLPRDGFEDRTRLILRYKFPNAAEKLITKLFRSIAFRRHRLLYQRHHHKKMSHIHHTSLVEVESSKQQSPQSQNPHEHQSDSDTEPGPSTHCATSRVHRVDPQDDGRKRQASTVFAGESPWIEESGYPIPPKAEGLSISAMCQICFQELQVVGNEDPTWWERHVESDMEHYICLSDDCGKSLCYFRSFDSWIEHMNREHSHDWSRFTYAKKSEWRCRVSENCSISFDNEDSLRAHLADNHLSDLEDLGLTDLQLVVEKSKFPQPRESDICPLCEESINDSEPVIQNSKAENDGSHKKVRQRPDGQQSTLGALQNDENKGKRPASNTNSSIRSNEMQSRKASHIADHLKSISLLCLWGLGTKGEEQQEEDSGADICGDDSSEPSDLNDAHNASAAFTGLNRLKKAYTHYTLDYEALKSSDADSEDAERDPL
ncbi:uncharacterized protein Triagg1_6041 [Trichoderma aggressivum f. europaeum]|uniref:C2H2-type domain-containing protein n=1 Tax=Trichoderma aggressivum f. europaeum TaxID=173218 RepID=A0AAE1IBG5_9HYPO|nr:hypothetical protein Triagg1_6041 [Trichoderma aggressivum f. europaeum]